MPCKVVGQPFPDTASFAYDAQLYAHHTTAAISSEDKAVIFFFHRLLRHHAIIQIEPAKVTIFQETGARLSGLLRRRTRCIFKSSRQQLPYLFDRIDTNGFVGRMREPDVRPERNHIHIRICLLNDSAFEARMHHRYDRLLPEKFFVRRFHRPQNR